MKARTHYHSGLRRQNMENISRGRATGAAYAEAATLVSARPMRMIAARRCARIADLALGRIRRNADGVPEPAGERVAATRVQTSGCSRWHRAIRPAARRETRRNYCRDGNALHGFIRKLLRQDAPELLAKILARKLLAAARKRNADNLHALWFDAPKPLDGQTGRRWPARGA